MFTKGLSESVIARDFYDPERNIHHYANHPGEISARLQELDKKWDIERTLEANASTVTLLSMVLGPPLPLYRRLSVRTQTEIERERYALKALRGDFSNSDIANNKQAVMPLRRLIYRNFLY